MVVDAFPARHVSVDCTQRGGVGCGILLALPLLLLLLSEWAILSTRVDVLVDHEGSKRLGPTVGGGLFWNTHTHTHTHTTENENTRQSHTSVSWVWHDHAHHSCQSHTSVSWVWHDHAHHSCLCGAYGSCLVHVINAPTRPGD